MKKTIKNLYLPGTNKNVGYLDKDTLHIYKRHMKYFSFPSLTFPSLKGKTHTNLAPQFVNSKASFGPVLFMNKENKLETHMELSAYQGFILNTETNMYEIFNCAFTTPDNLDVIEMAYLYKNWKAKKNG